jgi:hypothetical protein
MSNINALSDILLIKSLFDEDTERFYKQAGVANDFLNHMKDYFKGHINPNDKTGSVINLLVPGILITAFGSFGATGLGIFIAILVRALHIDVAKLLTPLCESVKSMISGGSKVSSSQVSAAAAQAAAQYSSTMDAQPEATFAEMSRGVRILKLAAIDLEHQTLRLTNEQIDPVEYLQKTAAVVGAGLVVSLLGKLFGLMISVILWSAGFMVVGDIIDHFLSGSSLMPSSTSSSSSEEQDAPAPTPTQTKFHPKGGEQPLPKSIHITNTPENIDNMIVQFAKDVYDGLDGKESIIRNSAGFKAVKHAIVWYNTNNAGSAEVFIPALFSSKKRMVDNFIDDVARNSA